MTSTVTLSATEVLPGEVELSATEVLPGEVEPDGAHVASALELAESRTVVGRIATGPVV
ncbi:MULTISPECIES: hypothetical protein [unclassified Streptomyces]|uniref:hypothetical protein n=1 Tax=unclassified Streptomyces TaxID=2593676 RepID=UPI00164FDBB6|nr:MULTISPECIES: hypothetical protein [unclassified Streptomyces]WSQ88017.1 hypothetical protein OG722_28270 [Streptomyces sp. NBC_01212]